MKDNLITAATVLSAMMGTAYLLWLVLIGLASLGIFATSVTEVIMFYTKEWMLVTIIAAPHVVWTVLLVVATLDVAGKKQQTGNQ